jgi:hypothetical protein
VAKAVAREVVVAHLHDQSRLDRLPLRRALGAPAAGPARGAAGEAGRLDQRLELRQERHAGGGREAGREADVMEQPIRVVEPEQERAHRPRARRVAESAHHAVHRAAALHLLHAGALAGPIGQVELLGHDAVERATGHLEPRAGLGGIVGGRGEPDVVTAAERLGCEGLESAPALAEGPLDERLARGVHQEVEDDEHRRTLP